MADETEETWGAKPNEPEPKTPTGKEEASASAGAGSTMFETQAEAAGQSRQEAAAAPGDSKVGGVYSKPETVGVGAQAIVEASPQPEDVAAIVQEPGGQTAGPEKVAADEEEWERETVASSASALPRGFAAPSGATQPAAESAVPSSEARSSGNRSAAGAGVGGRKGNSGFPGGWGSELNKPGLGLLYDVELDATLQFGSKEMLLRDVLELGPGDVVELDSHISEPVDLVVGDRIVARGEVVVASGNFALRVTEVATPQMRLESIRCLF